MKTVSEEKPLLMEFAKGYREQVGELYVPCWGGDLKMLKELRETLSSEKLSQLIEQFFKAPRKAYSLRWFRVIINDLVQEMRKPKEAQDAPVQIKKKMVNPDAERFIIGG